MVLASPINRGFGQSTVVFIKAALSYVWPGGGRETPTAALQTFYG